MVVVNPRVQKLQVAHNQRRSGRAFDGQLATTASVSRIGAAELRFIKLM